MSKLENENFDLPDEANFVQMEEKVLAHWRAIDAFGQQLRATAGKPLFTFYDGPPFATGLPHAGHIAVGTLKDVITRYASMTGRHCPRNFGWDCHGLPIEYEIDKTLQLTDRRAVYEMGIDKYNSECRKIVSRYSNEWKSVVERVGRWIDMDNAYRTMDLPYMESVWWVFKQIFDKGYVYRGCRVMAYSTRISTVLSNFEASSNYKDRVDPAIVVAFPLAAEPEVSLLAWTTTPWSLPANLALAVHPALDYVRVRDLASGRIFVLARVRLCELYKNADNAKLSADVTVKKRLDRRQQAAKSKIAGPSTESVAPSALSEETAPVEKEESSPPEYEVLASFLGAEMIGWEYVPLFDYFHASMKPRGCFRVYGGEYVSADTGTGIVHTCPAYGEDDYEICLRNGLIEPDGTCDVLDDDGKYLSHIAPFAGKHCIEANTDIMDNVAEKGRLIKRGTLIHAYPLCWRSGAPLIYRAMKTWFIRVSTIRDKLVENNSKVHWVPKSMQKRFAEWLENAEDWCFSRSRFWGNPIPLWVSDDGEEVICVGSLAELRSLAGLPADYPISDMHREHIDGIQIPSQRGKGMLRRIEEVFDCWFESGAMPYAQFGTPNAMPLAEFARHFPANFISEGSDQVRGWFYTLNVISAILFNDSPYRNIVAMGMIKASDGDKLSKSKKNYTDPLVLVQRVGADALRLYFMNSPLVRAEEMRFKDEELLDVVKRNFIPWYNLCRLLNQEIARYALLAGRAFVHDESAFGAQSTAVFANATDRWLLARLQCLTRHVHTELGAYRLYSVLAEQLAFLNELGNWYVKLNKTRMRGDDGVAESHTALNTLFHCFLQLLTLIAPFVPFVTDYFYLNLRRFLAADSPLRAESIHLLTIPAPIARFDNAALLSGFRVFQALVSSVRKARERLCVNLKQPLPRLRVALHSAETREQLALFLDHLASETNVVDVDFAPESAHGEYVEFVLESDHRALGQHFKARYDQIRKVLATRVAETPNEFARDGRVVVEITFGGECERHELGAEFLALKARLRPRVPSEGAFVDGDADFAYELDARVSAELRLRGLAREITNRVQRLRKDLKLCPTDSIGVALSFAADGQLAAAFRAHRATIAAALKQPLIEKADALGAAVGAANFSVEGEAFVAEIYKPTLSWRRERLAERVGADTLEAFVECAEKALGASGEREFDVLHNNEKYTLKLGEDFNIY